MSALHKLVNAQREEIKEQREKIERLRDDYERVNSDYFDVAIVAVEVRPLRAKLADAIKTLRKATSGHSMAGRTCQCALCACLARIEGKEK